MINKLLRIFITLIGFTIGYQIMALVIYLNSFTSFIDISSISPFVIEFAGAVIFAIIFYFISSKIVDIGYKFKEWMECHLQKTPMRDIIYGFVGLLMGLLIANFFSRALLTIPLIGDYLPVAANLILGYTGATVALKKKEELSELAEFITNIAQKKEKPLKTTIKHLDRAKPKILDTSVIIDGRIADICKTGFIEGKLVIPNFVLEELRHIADSSDTLKRNRGRRGLDILNKIQKELDIKVEIYEGDFEDIAEVDSKLVKLAQVLDGAIITNDFNLNKVAELQNVPVLNINELANAVKPVVLPGEEMEVQVIKNGKEVGQGVGYLDDGTMIVIDGGKEHIGETIAVIVTSVLQTAAGRMIFAKPNLRN